MGASHKVGGLQEVDPSRQHDKKISVASIHTTNEIDIDLLQQELLEENYK